VHGAETHPNAPGLHFTGYTNPISGMFREIAIDVRRIAKAVASERSNGAAGRVGKRARGCADSAP
jgi:putative flavoprotein involved in K+ transport